MPHDARKAEIVREWLARGIDDLTIADRALEPPEIPGAAAFHSQQAVEKALKGYLTWHDRTFRWTHDLILLVRECESVDEAFSALREPAEALTPFASQTRYPGYGVPLTIEDARIALASAHESVEFIRSRLADFLKPGT